MEWLNPHLLCNDAQIDVIESVAFGEQGTIEEIRDDGLGHEH